jgi:phosphoglycerate dehydrogenase-like enzyme
MHVVVVDRSLERFSADLEAAVPGASWAYLAPDDEAGIRGELPAADVFVGSRFPTGFAAHAARLKLVHAAGAGTDAIDTSALGGQVMVANVFEHERSIAEHVLMVMLALSRQLLEADRSLRRGRWLSSAQDPKLPLNRSLAGRTVGIVGLGHIGREIACITAAMGMTVQAVRRSPVTGNDAAPVGFLGGPDDLPQVLAASDFVVVCVPLSEHTRHLIGSRELEMMRRDAYLINVARGPIVEERSLYEALRDDRIAGAALDVWYQAPPRSGDLGLPASLPFSELPNVILTPHYSGVTDETFRRRARAIGANLVRLQAGDELVNRLR